MGVGVGVEGGMLLADDRVVKGGMLLADDRLFSTSPNPCSAMALLWGGGWGGVGVGRGWGVL